MKQLLTAITLFAAATAVQAQDFDSVAREIALRNPQVASIKASYDAQIADAQATNALAGIEVDFDYKFNSEQGDDRWGFSVGQSFDWPGLYHVRRKAGEYRADAFRDLYVADYVSAALEAKQTLIALAVAQQQLAVLEEADRATVKLAEAYDYAFSQGETTILETSKIKLQRFAIANRVAEAEALVEKLKGDLRALNGGEDCTVPSLENVNLRLQSFDHYREIYEANDPTLRANGKLAQAAAADVKAATAGALPSFKLAYIHDYEEGIHFNGFSVGISLPQWNGGKSARKAAKAVALADELGAIDYTHRLNARLTADYAECSRLDDRLDKARRAFIDDEYPALLQKALDARKITLFDYLREYNEYLDAKAEYIDLCGRAATAAASLDRYNLLPQ